ncbi:UNVERIFIED_CONTAM: hypothetical protein RMT77_016400 [Armadillidium vulgare]
MKKTEFHFSSYKFDKEKAHYLRNPLFIGDFSLDSKRNFHADKRNLKFIDLSYLTKKTRFDLNKNIDKSVKKNISETKTEKLDKLLQWILCNKEKFFTEESKETGFKSLSTDFVCFRGLLTELLCTPYEYREGWIIYATRFAGTIYLVAVDTPEKEQQRLSETGLNKAMSSWGYKFEQYMTNENTNEGVNENEEYCCVMRSRLLNHSLVYGAEVDGADESLYHSPHSSLSAFIELKTCKELVNQREINNFYRFRLRKWWAQSYLVGIPRVICGFRNLKGVVHSLKSFNVDEMPSMSKIHWDKDVMFNFLNEFLSWVKIVVEEDKPNLVYKFQRSPGEESITCTPLQPESGEEFLPKFYIKEIFKT